MSKDVLYLRNGKIWTGDPAKSKAEAMFVKDGRVLAVGSVRELDDMAEAAQAVRCELGGVTVIPGMSDCHIHVLTSSKWMQSVDVSRTKNCAEMLELLRRRAAELASDAWIYATGLNEMNWDSKSLPEARDLDAAGVPNPVLVHRICTHATVANSRAMKLAGMDERDLPGIRRDKEGRATGVLVEGAQLPAHDAMKAALYTRETLLEYLGKFLKYAASQGLTTLHSCSAKSLGMEEDLGLYQTLYEKNSLSCRVYNIHDELSVPPMGGVMGNDYVRFEGFKLFLDGSIGARTAAMSFPYADDSSTAGMLIHEAGELYGQLCESVRRGDHILAHAIGDRAIGQLVDAIEKACAAGIKPMHPYLLNHVEICPPELVKRIGKLPVACVVQPTYVPSDFDMVPERLGANEKYACVWKDFVDAGVLLCGSSDHPIEVLNPMAGIWSLVNRTNWDGSKVWHGEQKLSLDEALRIYTSNPAKAYGTWAWNGSLTAGKAADVVVLDRDISSIPPEELRDVRVSKTLLGGRLAYGEITDWPCYN